MKVSVLFFLGIMGLIFGIAGLFFILVRKVFSLYQNKKFAYFFWTMNFGLLLLSLLVRGDFLAPMFAMHLMEFATLWLMIQLFSLPLLPLYYLAKQYLVRRMQTEEGVVDLERRRLIKGMAVSLPIATMGVSAYGTFYASKEVKLLRYDIELSRLDRTLAGFQIAQISDVHIGLFFSSSKFKHVLQRLVDARADVLVITGDLIDDLTALPQVVQILNEFTVKFPHGIYFSWGNHEYFRDFKAIESAFRQSSVKVLRNESVLLVKADKPLYLIGVDYPWAKEAEAQKAECREMLTQGIVGVEETATKVLLSHHPMLIDYAYEFGIDLCLTGHTHGGQVAMFGQALLPVKYKYMRGMYRRENQYGYVSTGAGSWFPFRLGCPAEIAIFTLR